MVAVIVFTDQISMFIKCKFVGVTKSGCKYFKITPIRISPCYNTTIGIFPFFSCLVFSVKANISNLPINPAVWTHFHTRHSMTTKSYMNPKTSRNGCFFICYSITIIVFHSPQIRRHSNKKIFPID